MEPPPHSTDSQHSDALSFLAFEQGAGGLPNVGADIGEYVLLSVLGRGASGVVFEASQKSLGRRVALKLIPLGPADRTAAGHARLQQEGQLLASLHHPNIIEVFDTGITPEYRWLAMELVRGHNFAEVMAGKVQDLPTPASPKWLAFTIPILQQVSSALASAHEHGIVHRDVKPSNILLDSDGNAHLVDFGLAEKDQQIQNADATGFIGTPLYASPEQARNEPLTAASDVFSLGAVAFEALNGSPPFGGRTTKELLRAVQFADPTWKNNKGTPQDIRAVVDKCLEKNVLNSYSSAGEVAEEFARFLRFEPVQAIPRTRFSRWLQRTLRTPGRALVTGSLIILGSVVLISGLVVQIQGSQLHEFRSQEKYEDAEALWHRSLFEAFHERIEKMSDEDRWRLLGDYQLLETNLDAAAELYAKVTPDPLSLADHMAPLLAKSEYDLTVPPQLPVGLEPHTPRDWLFMCLYYNQTGEFEKTLEAVQIASNFHPTSFPLHFLEGLASRGLGQTESALNSLHAALALQPDSAQALRHVGRVLKSAKRYEESEAFFRQAIEVAPESARIWADLANMLLAARQLEKGEIAAQRAAELDPDLKHPWVTSVRAQLLNKKRKFEEEGTLLLRALELTPTSLHLWSRLGWLRLCEEKWEEVLEISERLVDQPYPGWKSRGYSLRGRALIELGRMDDACLAYRASGKLRPDMGNWSWNLLRRLLSEGSLDAANQLLEYVLETDPTQFKGLLFSVELHLLRGNPGDIEEAHALALRAAGLKPDSAQAQYWLAFTYAELGYAKLALVGLEKALAFMTSDPKAQDPINQELNVKCMELKKVCLENLVGADVVQTNPSDSSL